MATANIYITNKAGGRAFIQLYHQNDATGIQGGAWFADAGQTVGPLVVEFETDTLIADYWAVRLSVIGGADAGAYKNTGSILSDTWKECRLESADADTKPVFTVDTKGFGITLVSGGCSDDMKRTRAYTPVANVFVLMLENHSFDNIFAMSGIPGILAATTSDKNSYNGTDYYVKKTAPANMPTDPGHEFMDVVEQLCGKAVTAPVNPYPQINNSGYASNYATSVSEDTGRPTPAQIGDIMQCFDTPNQLPVTYQLATQFAICDQWFSSLPGPTWPNRFFLHGASSAGLDHSPTTEEIIGWETVVGSGFVYPKGSIFDAMNKAKLTWRLYNDDTGPIAGQIAQVHSLQGISFVDMHDVSDLAADLQGPYDAQYTFIEPSYGNVADNSYEDGSSQHPKSGVSGGEALIKTVYEAIRNSPVWNSSLLIIIYDEHGGFYDSGKPGAAPAPADGSRAKLNQFGFTFEQYGVRVPAVMVSPFIARGVVDHTPYDHASVPATLERMFGMPPLTQRDAKAKDLIHLLSSSAPRTDCPVTLNAPVMPAPAIPAAPVTAATPAGAMMMVTSATTAKPVADDLRPLPTSGNYPGFLHVLLKSQLELAKNAAERKVIIENFKQIKTMGQARVWSEQAAAQLKTAKAAARVIKAKRVK